MYVLRVNSIAPFCTRVREEIEKGSRRKRVRSHASETERTTQMETGSEEKARNEGKVRRGTGPADRGGLLALES